MDAPVRRVAALNTPVPSARAFEEEVLPYREKIIRALRGLVSR
jgi:pyruvate/2-oxoglutarate/acetoin dehydrogenase E1 component